MLLILPNTVWVSPAQWGSALWLAVVLVCLALLVLFKIPRRDMAPIFLTLWAVTLFARALWLGDPLTIPMHQLQNGALLIFAFFMISDPKTIPDRLIGRYIFALAVCALSYIMIFEFRLREGLFYALAIVSIIRPLIDFMFKSEAFQWRKPITGEIL